jgi:hypothetical protein
MNTVDRLIDPDRRSIETTFVTTERVAEGTYDAGTVQVTLTTSHDKDRKRLRSVLNREVRTDSGFITRRFTIFGPGSMDAGLTLATQPIARFNAKKARDLHADILRDLDQLLAFEDRQPEVAKGLAELLATARTNA